MLIFLIFLIAAIIYSELIYIRKVKALYKEKITSLQKQEARLKETLKELDVRFRQLEEGLVETFFMYELAGKISPVLDKDTVLKIFRDEIRCLESIESAEFASQPEEDYLHFELETTPPTFLRVKVKSSQIEGTLKAIVKTINLCLERIYFYDKLQELSIHDSLTWIYNLRYFMLRFSEEFERAKKFGLNLSLMMVDIDYFKKVNDTYGHIVGDVVLKEIAKVIKENIREIDFVARYGGEEFVVLLQETDKEGAIFVGERIIKKINSLIIRAFDENLKVTVSIGLASFPQETSSKDTLIEIADKALYKAKGQGRNRLAYFN